MCRGANLGTCCRKGCDNRIRCRDTGGYCDEHDPYNWEDQREPGEDDPEKRRIYTLLCLNSGIRQSEATISAEKRKLKEMRARVKELTR